MIKKIALLALSLAAGLAALPQPKAQPEHPVRGDKVTWTVDTMYRSSQSPVMILVTYGNDTSIAQVLKGTRSGDAWSFTAAISKTAQFLAYKIEDDESPLSDDEGEYFGLPVYDEQGNPMFDSYRIWTNLYTGSDSAGNARALELVREELKYHPANWPALVLMRQLELITGTANEAAVAAEFDSLLVAEAQPLEPLYFAALEFFLNSSGYQPRGVEIMKTCAEKYPASRYWAWERYTIYSYISLEPSRLGSFENEIFPLLKGKAREMGYVIIMTYAMSSNPKARRVEDLTDGFLKEFPSSPMAPAFIISTLEVKYQEPNLQWAEEMESWQKRYRKSSELNLRLAEYYRDRDWKKALSYYKLALKTAKTPEPALSFADAAASKGKNMSDAEKALSESVKYTEADFYREFAWWLGFKKRNVQIMESRARLHAAKGWLAQNSRDYAGAVEEYLRADSLLVASSGYDKLLYERLLESSERKGDLKARKVALLNLILIRPNDVNIKSFLEDIYRLENGTVDGFGEWLTAEVLKNYYRVRLNVPIPDFPLFDAANNQVNLSEYAGKIVVINYWATWCEPCKTEIPELNQLVTQYQGKDVVFIALSNENPNLVGTYLKQNPFEYQIFYDRVGLSQYLELNTIPIHLVIDRYGRLQYLHVGALPGIREILTSEINLLLDM